MGRHSASADDEVDDVHVAPAGTSLDLSPRTRGRHSSRDDAEPDERPTQMIAVVDADLLEQAEPHDSAATGEFAVVAAPAPASVPATEVDSDAEQRAADTASAEARKVAEKAADDERKAAEKRAAEERKAADKAAAAERKATDDAAAAQRKAAKQSAKAEQKAARGETNTQADVRLLRTSGAVRAQCIAAVVVAFGLYTLVMAIIGRLSHYALFVWVPIVVSGVLVGLVLDLAHRRASRLEVEPSAVESETSPSKTSPEPETSPESDTSLEADRPTVVDAKVDLEKTSDSA